MKVSAGSGRGRVNRMLKSPHKSPLRVVFHACLTAKAKWRQLSPLKRELDISTKNIDKKERSSVAFSTQRKSNWEGVESEHDLSVNKP